MATGWFRLVPRVALGAAKPSGGVLRVALVQGQGTDLAWWAGGSLFSSGIPDGPVVVQATEGGIFVPYYGPFIRPIPCSSTFIRWSRSKRLQPQASAGYHVDGLMAVSARTRVADSVLHVLLGLCLRTLKIHQKHVRWGTFHNHN